MYVSVMLNKLLAAASVHAATVGARLELLESLLHAALARPGACAQGLYGQSSCFDVSHETEVSPSPDTPLEMEDVDMWEIANQIEGYSLTDLQVHLLVPFRSATRAEVASARHSVRSWPRWMPFCSPFSLRRACVVCPFFFSVPFLVLHYMFCLLPSGPGVARHWGESANIAVEPFARPSDCRCNLGFAFPCSFKRFPSSSDSVAVIHSVRAAIGQFSFAAMHDRSLRVLRSRILVLLYAFSVNLCAC